MRLGKLAFSSRPGCGDLCCAIKVAGGNDEHTVVAMLGEQGRGIVAAEDGNAIVRVQAIVLVVTSDVEASVVGTVSTDVWGGFFRDFDIAGCIGTLFAFAPLPQTGLTGFFCCPGAMGLRLTC